MKASPLCVRGRPASHVAARLNTPPHPRGRRGFSPPSYIGFFKLHPSVPCAGIGINALLGHLCRDRNQCTPRSLALGSESMPPMRVGRRILRRAGGLAGLRLRPAFDHRIRFAAHRTRGPRPAGGTRRGRRIVEISRRIVGIRCAKGRPSKAPLEVAWIRRRRSKGSGARLGDARSATRRDPVRDSERPGVRLGDARSAMS